MEIYLIIGLGLAILIAFVVLLRILKSRSSSTAAPHSPLNNYSEPEVLVTHTNLIESTGAKFVALVGEMKGRVWEIPASRKGLTIGRGSSNDVVLSSDMMVSRNHAQVIFEHGKCVLYDRDSVNGVFVNDRRIIRHVLRRDDIVQICNTNFRFTAQGDIGLPLEEKPSPKIPAGADSMQMARHSEFDGYLLEGKIGQGGMSVVYKAYDAHRQPVAIKVLDVDDDYIVRKFIQEGEIGKALRNHPNICRVYGSGRAVDQRFYLVMEFIPGVSLRELVGRNLGEAQIAHILGQVCDALHYAHLQNIVHRDIKPENIIVNSDNYAKVTDFGIAKLTSSVTVTKDRTVGTPEYISPEQAQAQQVRPASDIYSLGVVLYELLTGQPPFPMQRGAPPREATISVLFQHIHKEPVPPSAINPRVSRNLEAIALRALAKSPEQRFASAWEMACAMGYQRRALVTPFPEMRPGKLVLINGPRRGHSVQLSAPSMVIGRTQIAPDDRYISEQHIKIVQRGRQWLLVDRSRNGTWINGERVFGEVPITPEDVICVGKYQLRIELQANT